MKLLIFALVLTLLVAGTVSATGLKITEIDYTIDYDEAYTYRVERKDRLDSGSVSPTNNSRIDADLFPGSNITFTVRIENTFPSGGPTIKGAFARMTIEEIDDGSDLEFESFDFDLEPGDDYRYDIEFTIPLDVDAGLYNTLLEAEGEDSNGTSYKSELNLKVQVRKQSHDIRITRALLEPSVVSCDRKVKLTADVMNLGSNPENQNSLEFKSNPLYINFIDRGISLQSSDEASEEEKIYSKSLNFEVPSSLGAGAYPIFVNLYWKEFVLFDQMELKLNVKECDSTPTPGNRTDAMSPKTQEPAEEQTQAGDYSYNTGSEEQSLLISPTSVFVLAGALAMLVIIAVLVFMAKRTNKKV